MTGKRCDGCDHWRPGLPVMDGDRQVGRWGECHKRAPKVAINKHGVAMTIWPGTADSDRCGKWKEETI